MLPPSAYFCILPSNSAIPFKWTLVVVTIVSYKIFDLLDPGQRVGGGCSSRQRGEP